MFWFVIKIVPVQNAEFWNSEKDLFSDLKVFEKMGKPRSFFKKKWANPRLFLFIFGLFKQTLIQFLQQINVKNVHPVYGTGIRTHGLQNVSLLP